MTSQPSKTPWVTLALIALCLGAGVLGALRPDLAEGMAFRPRTPRLDQAVMSLFAHKNLWHLLGNMLFLAAVGPLVEFARGGLRLALVTLVSGLVGVAAFWGLAQSAGTDTALLGASGAVAGLVAFASVLFVKTKVPLLPNFGVPVWALTAIWVACQGLGALGAQAGAGVAYTAHLGGFLAGLALSVLLGASKAAQARLGHEVLDRMNDRGPAALLAAADAHLEAHPGDRKAQRDRAQALTDMGDHADAIRAWQTLLGSSALEDQAIAARALTDLKGWPTIPPIERLRLAERLLPQDAPQAVAILRSFLAPVDDPYRPDALYELAEASETDRPAAVAELTRHYALHPATDRARRQGWCP